MNNTGAGHGATQFLSEALSLLGAQHRIRCVRADSGFYADSFPTRLVSFASNFGTGKAPGASWSCAKKSKAIKRPGPQAHRLTRLRIPGLCLRVAAIQLWMSGVIIMAELAVECRIDELKNELAILMQPPIVS